eukprot:161981_1
MVFCYTTLIASNGNTVTSYVSFLRLDHWGQNEMNMLKNKGVITENFGPVPNNAILKKKHEFYKANSQAYYSTQQLPVLSKNDFEDINNNFNWYSFCKFRDSKDPKVTDRHLKIKPGALPNNYIGP